MFIQIKDHIINTDKLAMVRKSGSGLYLTLCDRDMSIPYPTIAERNKEYMRIANLLCEGTESTIKDEHTALYTGVILTLKQPMQMVKGAIAPKGFCVELGRKHVAKREGNIRYDVIFKGRNSNAKQYNKTIICEFPQEVWDIKFGNTDKDTADYFYDELGCEKRRCDGVVSYEHTYTFDTPIS